MDVRFDGVRFARDGREVLAIPELHVRGGRATAVLGPNGAGKTTLLRLIAGLDVADTGRVSIAGETAGSRHIAYVFQEQVFLRRSLLENLVLGLRIRGLDRAQARDRAMDALRQLGIDSLAGRRADQMSGGEGRRASLARALCLRAPVLLLDEPMAGLDGATYARLVDELPGLFTATGATTLVVTHDRDEAFRLCEDLVVLVEGRVLAAGPKYDVATNPRTAAVAEVLGYTVLELGRQRVAVPDRALHVGSGRGELTATVEAVLDIIREWDLVVTVGQSRVHVSLPRTAVPPGRGERILVHPHVMYDVS